MPLLHRLGGVWDIPPARVDYFAALHKPAFAISGSIDSSARVVTVGRASLHAIKTAGAKSKPTAFSPTKHALRLLERISAAVTSAESVLLIGETGNGKTAVIQHLASLVRGVAMLLSSTLPSLILIVPIYHFPTCFLTLQVGQTLVVQNLNQQSESSDLLGGWKPSDLKAMASPILHAFGRLFPGLFRYVHSRGWSKTVFPRSNAGLVLVLTSCIFFTVDQPTLRFSIASGLHSRIRNGAR